MRITRRLTWWLVPALVFLSGPKPAFAQAEQAPYLAAFALGRGTAATKTSVKVQHLLRELVSTSGKFLNVDLLQTLDPGSAQPRIQAIEEAQKLLREGKAAYEQLDLEQAQVKFNQALEKFEIGYGHLKQPSELVETLLYLGATRVLVGEPREATEAFLRAHELPGNKVLDQDLFPPNIQSVFSQAVKEEKNAPRGDITLTTIPAGAEIQVDGLYRGRAPVGLKNLRPGIHLVRAIKDGYRPWGGKVKVSKGKTRHFKMRLKPAEKQKEFFLHYRLMTSEILRNKPGEAITKLADFLRARWLAVVVLEGTSNNLTLNGHLFRTEGELRFASVKEVLDTADPAFNDRLKEFLLKLVAPTGETEMAALLVSPKQEEKAGTADTGPGKAPSLEEGVAQATTKGEQTEKERLELALQETKRDNQEQSFFSWGYLSDKWWFWTALGVLATGAVTGSYFLVNSGGAETGNLMIDMH